VSSIKRLDALDLIPGEVVVHDGVEEDQEFSHYCDNGDFRRLVLFREAAIGVNGIAA